MYFDSLSDFFNMGGHALYVWTSFGISLLLMAANILLPWWNLKRTRAQLQRQLRREAALNTSATTAE
ncbi:heme exporter protein CcmD [Marinospirillum alkaliphilum]|jgi:heme exporter protein D|uniref:Heme exporter protein D n=1 Tax=Marinospirillum alkaliphilum DSM 21637 TaxID=1122209 RepID=A0A1K1VCD0_9GAMM|nr:heme exporter protein CcmD [Marinospirillum alkaliphilum]SFX22786.1 heme exporter protein D [Marinospirillum alkaliphilum DSM 21637]